jgi:hypothetical protein
VSELEDFLSRWVQRKHEAAAAAKGAKSANSAEGADVPPTVPDDPTPETVAPPADTSAPPASEPTLDLSALPPIESITATTDIRGFLAPGVPADLTRAALRRAWLVDPQVRDFIGIAENQWDFTDPNSIPGFGTFGPLDDVSRLVARVIQMNDVPVISEAADARELPAVGEILDSSTQDMVANATTSEMVSGKIEQPVPAVGQEPDVRCSDDSDAVQKRSDAESPTDVPDRRQHGGALPK